MGMDLDISNKDQGLWIPRNYKEVNDFESLYISPSQASYAVSIPSVNSVFIFSRNRMGHYKILP